MKKQIILLIALAFLVGCTESNSHSSSSNDLKELEKTEDTTEDTEEVKIVREISEETPIILSFLTDNGLYFYDGSFLDVSVDTPKSCGFRCFTNGDEKLFFGDDGQVIASEKMDFAPDLVLDNWSVKKINPSEAQALGAMPRDYTGVYDNGIESGYWFENQYEAVKLIKTDSDQYLIIDNLGNFHTIGSEISGINHANRLLIYDFDASGRTATIESDSDYQVSWLTNNFNGARDWQFADGVWYSWNGYEFDGSLGENANQLYEFNSPPFPIETLPGEYPVLISAGVRDSKLYWLECNSGWLFEHIPENDDLNALFRIFVGDGLRASGLTRSKEIAPVLIGQFLYFYDSDSTFRIDLDSGTVELFFAGKGRIEKW